MPEEEGSAHEASASSTGPRKRARKDASEGDDATLFPSITALNVKSVADITYGIDTAQPDKKVR